MTKRVAHGVAVAALCASNPLLAQSIEPTTGMLGTPGIIDMPTAYAAPDGRFSTSISTYDGGGQTSLVFQIAPRLTGAFRYSTIDQVSGPGSPRTWDRSFDLQYQILTETDRRPAVAIGMRDFIGTGLFSSEYVVATKTFGDRLTLTGGMGWGRLGSKHGFTNPLGVFDDGFETRPDLDFGEGGDFDSSLWFRGDAAIFGGVTYQFNDDLTLKAEFSTDGYTSQVNNGVFDRDSSLNFGAVYTGYENLELGAYYLYGSTIGVSATFHFDPKDRPAAGGLDRGALPIVPRPAGAQALGWDIDQSKSIIRQQITTVLEADGFELVGMQLERNAVRVRVRNTRYRATSQAVGRIARGLTATLPASVETFVIEPMNGNVASTAVTLKRSDLERFDNAPDGAWEVYARTKIEPAGPKAGLERADNQYPKLSFGVLPYTELTLFDPDRPLRIGAGIEASGTLRLAEGLSLQGAVRKRLVGGFDDAVRDASDSPLPPVRSDGFRYLREGDPSLDYLTVEYLFRPSDDLYGRVTAGYLEAMYGGVSAELLWKPVNSRLGLGAEVNYVKQRDFDKQFGFQAYDVVTGHVSAYYEFGEEYHAQLDVGRYLAGDVGGTLTLTREFDSGWRIGAFATLTDVSSADFGEGSFDKGLIVEAPVDWILGQPNRRTVGGEIRPIQRDGGARLSVPNRLYRQVKDTHRPDLEARWGRFWK
ncbi:YjbH domain-containing protein [Nereida sp. MMG025]|uniref:YjbH domain-containing protein n=1 Tax=Nereida sp. MMG025 TaxID=2909981 RepID=UPI001F29527D|nr:YjbH domain-containing protein [Nereida sp. MMG025]MCF6444750.1 YjbH domain-containing protein [Nereida sp. MMG025]